jgi:CMP-N,N'-diacetyllegionaminic acid synthase
MNVLAIVPARGGSKGIPGKNLAMCAGKPLIEWTLDVCEAANLFTVVSTDSEEINNQYVYRSRDIIIGFELSISDDAQIEDRIGRHIRSWKPEIIVLLQPTSPVRTGKQIDEAITQLQREGADSLVSVVESHGFFWNTRPSTEPDNHAATYPGLGVMSNYDPNDRPRRQDIGHQYEENGSIYVFTREHWERTHNRLGGKIGMYVMPEECRQQVDTPFDLWLVEQILVRQHSLITGNAL